MSYFAQRLKTDVLAIPESRKTRSGQVRTKSKFAKILEISVFGSFLSHKAPKMGSQKLLFCSFLLPHWNMGSKIASKSAFFRYQKPNSWSFSSLRLTLRAQNVPFYRRWLRFTRLCLPLCSQFVQLISLIFTTFRSFGRSGPKRPKKASKRAKKCQKQGLHKGGVQPCKLRKKTPIDRRCWLRRRDNRSIGGRGPFTRP